MKTFEEVKEEVKKVYVDCQCSDAEYPEMLSRRNLDYFCDTSVTPKEAFNIMSEASPGGYNNFKPELLLDFPEDSKIHIARESSICIYVENNVNVMIKYVDEFNMNKSMGDYTGLARYWWD